MGLDQEIRRRLSESALARGLHGSAHLGASMLPVRSPAQRLEHFAVAASRLAYSPARGLIAAAFARRLAGGTNPFREARTGWDRYARELRGDPPPALSTSLVLKASRGPRDPGVLYVSFEYNWLRLLKAPRWRELLADYVLIGASSWSPTNFGVLASLADASPHPVFIGISNMADMEAYRVLSPHIEPLPILASDWVDPALYQPRPKAARDIDILMVAHWGRFKRHELLFGALARMDHRLRVVLVGRDTEGRTAESMRAMARTAGCRQDLEIHTRIPNREVIGLQERAKIALNFSAREGSCVAITEAMAADTPVGVFHDAHIGAAAHVNAQTGCRLTYEHLHRQLDAFLAAYEQYTPRAWLTEHISAARSSARQAELVAGHSRLASGWTGEVAPMRWVYVPSHSRAEDRAALLPVAREFPERYGVELIEYPADPGAVG